MASGPGKTPEERAAADPTSEVESSRGLMSALGVTKARASAPPPQTAAPAFVLQPSFTASMSFLDAVAADNMEVVTRFVDQATKSAEEVEGGAGGACTPSSSAARHALLNQDSSGNLQGFTPWLMAAWKGADTALRWLAAQPEVDTDTRTANAMGAHAMHLAVIGGHFRVLHFLLSLPGADADVRDKQGCTPLIVAAQYGEVLCAHLLLRRGASPMAADECGDTPLHWAAYKGHEDLVILFATGAVRPLRPVRAVRPTGGLAIHCLIHLAPPAHPQRAPDVVLTDACPPLGINPPGVSVCVHGGGGCARYRHRCGWGAGQCGRRADGALRGPRRQLRSDAAAHRVPAGDGAGGPAPDRARRVAAVQGREGQAPRGRRPREGPLARAAHSGALLALAAQVRRCVRVCVYSEMCTYPRGGIMIIMSIIIIIIMSIIIIIIDDDHHQCV
jgi:hypothetical protein